MTIYDFLKIYDVKNNNVMDEPELTDIDDDNEDTDNDNEEDDNEEDDNEEDDNEQNKNEQEHNEEKDNDNEQDKNEEDDNEEDDNEEDDNENEEDDNQEKFYTVKEGTKIYVVTVDGKPLCYCEDYEDACKQSFSYLQKLQKDPNKIYEISYFNSGSKFYLKSRYRWFLINYETNECVIDISNIYQIDFI